MKRILPRIRFCAELPQWIIPSDRAAYHPATRTIWLTSWKYLFHEFVHYLADLLKLPALNGWIDRKHRKIYGISPLVGVLEDIEDMVEVKRITMEMARTFREADDRIHRGIMSPCPEKFTGLEDRLKRIKAEVEKEMADFPETVTWDHLPNPTWRDIKLREKEKP